MNKNYYKENKNSQNYPQKQRQITNKNSNNGENNKLTDKLLVAGIHPVEEALEVLPRDTLQKSKLYIADTRTPKDLQKIIDLAKSSELQPLEATMRELDKFSADTRHQGVLLALPNFPYADLDDILENHLSTPPLLLLLDQIQDPHNLGAIIRSAVAFHVDAILIPKDRCAQITSTSLKTSAGLAYKIPIVQITNLAMTIRKLKSLDFDIYGADIAGTQVEEVTWNRAVALVMGSESHGMRKLTRDLCDQFVRIKLADEVDSLNVSVASAILLYQRSIALKL